MRLSAASYIGSFTAWNRFDQKVGGWALGTMADILNVHCNLCSRTANKVCLRTTVNSHLDIFSQWCINDGKSRRPYLFTNLRKQQTNIPNLFLPMGFTGFCPDNVDSFSESSSLWSSCFWDESLLQQKQTYTQLTIARLLAYSRTDTPLFQTSF